MSPEGLVQVLTGAHASAIGDRDTESPDYGHIRFELEQAAKGEERRGRKQQAPTKEIRLLVGIADHDFEVKAAQVRRWLGSQVDVRVSIRAAGPEQEPLAEALLRRFVAAVEDAALGVTAQPQSGREVSVVVWSS